MAQEYQRRKTSVSLLHAHIVFAVKYRRRVSSKRMRKLLAASVRKTCTRLGATPVEAKGEADHLHLMVLFPPSLVLSKLVQAIKAESSGAVRRQAFPEVTRKLRGGAPLDIVKTYIQCQNADG